MTRIRSFRSLVALLAVAVAATLAACGSDDDPISPTTPGSLVRVSGDSQSVPVGTTIAQPMIVRLLSQSGSPVAGTSVTWTLASGASGTLAGVSSATDADGRASMDFTAGTLAGKAEVTASVGVLPVVTFTQTVVAGAPASLAKAGGDGIAALVNTGVQLAARAVDANGNAVAGVVVNFAVGAAGGTLSAATATTDASGLARVTLTVGATPGEYTVTATSGTLPAVTFRVTAI